METLEHPIEETRGRIGADAAPGSVRVKANPGLVDRFRRSRLFFKAMLANSVVVLFGAAAAFCLVRFVEDRYSLAVATAASVCGGVIVTIIVNYIVFSSHFRPLVELSRALEAIRRGQEARRAMEGVRAAGVESVLASVSGLLDWIEDGSVHFSARLLGSLEADRQRIGRELHDDTSQILAAALLKLDLALRHLPPESAAARQAVGSARDLLGRALDQLKSVTYDLRPTMLDNLGLAAALRWYVKARADRPGLQVTTRFDPVDERLPTHVETAMYRVGQEALANAVNHSGANRVELGLEIRSGYVALHVFDNGIGFDLAKAHDMGLGLISMRERVTLLGGKLNIVTEPGQGTRVYAVVPRPDGPAGT